MQEYNTHKLGNDDIQMIIDRLVGITEELKYERREVLRIRLVTEEVLLMLQERLGNEAVVNTGFRGLFSKKTVMISVAGTPFDPFEEETSGSSSLLNSMMAIQGLVPSWSYENGANVIRWVLRKQRKNHGVLKLVSAVALAVIAGLLINRLPAAAGEVIYGSIVTPLFDAFMRLISGVSGPLVLLSIVWGILGIGDTAMLGNVGRKLISRFVLISAVFAIISTLCYLPFTAISTDSTGGPVFGTLFEMILDIIPENAVDPFVTGNSLQIIFIAFVFGIAALIVSEKTSVVSDIVAEVNSIVQYIMEIINKLIPFFVFLSILGIFQSGTAGEIVRIWKLVVMLAAGMLLLLVLGTLAVRISCGLSPVLLWKKIFPAFLIGLTTSSSTAAFSTMIDNCRNKLGIDSKVVSIGVPLGQVIYKPGAAVAYTYVGIFMAEMYGEQLTVSGLISLLFVTIILSCASPPIPGGALPCYTIIMAQLGLPGSAVALCCAFNLIVDMFETPVNIALLHMTALSVGKKAGMVDEAVMMSGIDA